jgi:general secretion pathway protein I
MDSKRQRETRRGFVLLEVLVALAILGGAMAALMRGFTVAVKTARQDRIITMAMILGQRLMEEYEIEAPPEGRDEGHFGEEFPGFLWEREVQIEPVHYSDPRASVAGRDFADMVFIHLKIFFDDGSGFEPFVAMEMDSALTQIERFTHDSRLRGGLFEHESI